MAFIKRLQLYSVELSLNEHSYIRSIHDKLRKKCSSVYIWKINDNYCGGVPDCFYCDNGIVLFAEFKFIKLPKRESTVIDPFKLLSLQQQVWLKEREEQGIPCAAIIGAEEGSVVFNAYSDIREVLRKDFINGVTREEVAIGIFNRLQDYEQIKKYNDG